MVKNSVFLVLSIVGCVFLRLFSFTKTAPDGALVTHVPGFNGILPSNHYAGYVTIDETTGKKLFYYFVESQRRPSEDPVVLWLNGGPGCSSFDGFVYEHGMIGNFLVYMLEAREGRDVMLHLLYHTFSGPFNFELGKTGDSLPILHINPYSWSKVTNIIYLDSPSGVGLSYSGNETDYITGDLKTASDSHTFLLKWFELFKEFLPNPFYIAGESYAGVYVPTLASEVVKGIDARVSPILNFKGYMVGNGVADEEFDGNALLPFAHGMGLISDALYEEVVSECHGVYYESNRSTCATKLAEVDTAIADLNLYDILEPCYHSKGPSSRIMTLDSKLPLSFRKLGETDRPLPVRKRMFGRAWPLRAPVRDGIVPTWPQLLRSESVPCVDDRAATLWLNNAEVRKAIHAEQENVTGTFDLCTGKITFSHDAGSMIAYHKNLTSRGYRALVYSGDHDMCVPFTGSEAWTRSIGYETVDDWRPWIVNDQVAGYVQGYDHNLTFLTIKGAGHTVPEYKPQEALAFYTRWLEGSTI